MLTISKIINGFEGIRFSKSHLAKGGILPDGNSTKWEFGEMGIQQSGNLVRLAKDTPPV